MSRGPPAPRIFEEVEKGDMFAVRQSVARDPAALLARTQGYEETPLMRAAVKGHNDVLDYLLSVGAEVGAQRSGGFTSLHLAANVGVAESLLRHGADRTLESSGGKSPTEHCAGGAAVQQFIGAFESSLIGSAARSAPAPVPAPALAPAPPGLDPERVVSDGSWPTQRLDQASCLDQIKLISAAQDATEVKDYLLAFEKYTEAIEADAQNAEYYTARGACFLKMEKFREAKADGMMATRCDEASGAGWLVAAQACGLMDDYRQMRDLLDEAFERQPGLETAATCCEAAEAALRGEHLMEAVIEAGAALGKNVRQSASDGVTNEDVLAYLIRGDAQLAMKTERMYRKAVADYEKAMLAGMAAGNNDLEMQRRAAAGLRKAQEELASVRFYIVFLLLLSLLIISE